MSSSKRLYIDEENGTLSKPTKRRRTQDDKSDERPRESHSDDGSPFSILPVSASALITADIPLETPELLVQVVASSVQTPSPGGKYHDQQFSALSDELVLRILSFLSVSELVLTQRVSRRLCALGADRSLWRRLYYERFVRSWWWWGGLGGPRAAGGGNLSAAGGSSVSTGAIAASWRRRRRHDIGVPRTGRHHWEDGAWMGRVIRGGGGGAGVTDRQLANSVPKVQQKDSGERDWKKEYRLRHNWEVGRCTMQELRFDLDDTSTNSTTPALSSSPSSEEDTDDEDGDLTAESLSLRLSEAGGDLTESEDEDLSEHRDSTNREQRVPQTPSKCIVRISAGVAVTADSVHGLRAWHLRRRKVLARGSFTDGAVAATSTTAKRLVPCSLAVDEAAGASSDLDAGSDKKRRLGVAVAFTDGSWGMWEIDLTAGTVARGYSSSAAGLKSHVAKKSSVKDPVGGTENNSAPWIASAYSHPYILTAALVPDGSGDDVVQVELHAFLGGSEGSDSGNIRAPRLVTSLRSRTAQAPLALSIRRVQQPKAALLSRNASSTVAQPGTTAATIVASVAHTLLVRGGWCVGIQALHVTSPVSTDGQGGEMLPRVTATRLAYSETMISTRGSGAIAGLAARDAFSSPSRPSRSETVPGEDDDPPTSLPPTGRAQNQEHNHGGPTSLAYAHPYLLSALPDNTLVLHLVHGTASSLRVVSPGAWPLAASALAVAPRAAGPGGKSTTSTTAAVTLASAGPQGAGGRPTSLLAPRAGPIRDGSGGQGLRLWGHTSGVSGAEVTSRGRAVSVSRLGGEVRVWELEEAAVRSAAAATSSQVSAGAKRGSRVSGSGSMANVFGDRDGDGCERVGTARGAGVEVRPEPKRGRSQGGVGVGGGGGGDHGKASGLAEGLLDGRWTRYGAGDASNEDQLFLPDEGDGTLVGFDDEMVLVHREASGRKGGRLMVYDFA